MKYKFLMVRRHTNIIVKNRERVNGRHCEIGTTMAFILSASGKVWPSADCHLPVEVIETREQCVKLPDLFCVSRGLIFLCVCLDNWITPIICAVICKSFSRGRFKVSTWQILWNVLRETSSLASKHHELREQGVNQFSFILT